MAASQTPATHPADPHDRAIRGTRRALAGALAVLAVVVLLDLVAGPATPTGLLTIALVAGAGAAAWLHGRAVDAREHARRGETEGFARILRGLSRSVSPDAIVEAIVEELGVAAGADHVVVIRFRPNSGLLEATLVSRSALASSTTVLPLSDLEDPLPEVATLRPLAVAVGPGRPAPAWPPNGGVLGLRRAVGGVPAADADEDGGGGDRVAATGASADAANESAGRLVAGPAAADRIGGGGLGGASGDAADDRIGGRGLGGESGRGADAGAHLGAFDEAGERIAERLASRVRAAYGLKHTIVAPLAVDGGVVGAIVLSRRTSEPWPPSSSRLLHAAAVEASAALARAYSHRAAEERATTDALTGLPNRRYFDEYVGLFARRRRSDDAVGILMIDIDRFKRLNDTHGHAVGDQVLRAVAGAIASAVREDDVPARFGGEEFVVLLRNPGREVAVEVGERVREAVRRLDLGRLGIPEVSVSVGVAVASRPDEPIADLVEQADRALYRAKRAGRDRVVAR